MTLPDDWRADFGRDALYAPSAWFVDHVDALDPEAGTIHGRMVTTALPFVDAQRDHAGHPPHVPAAIVIQATGTLGQIFAVYALGLRPEAGWAGFGTHIHKARWGKIGLIGPELHLHATLTRRRKLFGTVFCDFDFEFTQDGERVYRSSQTAAWTKALGEAAG